MILSILSISSRGFAFGFPKKSHANGDSVPYYEPMIFLLISPCKTNLFNDPQTNYTIEPSLRPMEPSNNLLLIKARLLSLEPSNKVHYLFDTWVTFDYTFEAHNVFVRHSRILST